MLSLPDEVDATHVLVRGQRRSNHGVAHLPSSDDPEQPACDQHVHREDGTWNRVSVTRTMERWRLCKYCDPTHDVQKGTPGRSLADQIRDLAASNGGVDL